MRSLRPRGVAAWAVVCLMAHLFGAVGERPAADAAPLPPPAPGSVLVGCGQAATRLALTADTHLDPACTYTAGFEITASGVTLDCRGAVVVGPLDGPFGSGIAVHAPITTALHDVTIRNCRVQGFGNGVRVTRDGFRTLAAGIEYANVFRDIVIEDSDVAGARGVGIYVDGYVTGVTIRRTQIRGAGSAGIYLETGSKDNVVADNDVVGNGFRENGPAGSLVTVDGVQFRFWGPGREGIAVDSSRGNVITRNRVIGNSAGGIFLYKNCGEYYVTRAASWLERRYGADANLIEGNEISGGARGVWVGSRMGENTWPMECSAPAYVEAPFERYVLDEATDNVIAANRFHDLTYGVQIEDDRTVVAGNTFEGADPGQWAVIVGTRVRTAVLGRPVSGTVLRDNVATIAGNPDPFRWVHGEVDSTVDGNTAHGAVVGICEVPELPHGPFVMTAAFAPEPVGGPPTAKPPLSGATLGPQPACPAATTVVQPVADAVTAQPAFAG